jgi:hypothetical protein
MLFCFRLWRMREASILHQIAPLAFREHTTGQCGLVIVLSSVVLSLGIASPATIGADLRSCSIVHEQTIELYLVDGHIIYYGKGQNWDGRDNTVFYSPLNVAMAEVPSNYAITSPDDPAFASPVNPLRVYRKSRVIDVNSIFREPKYLFGHWLYLKLPKSLKTGCTYEITLSGIADNARRHRLVFDPLRHRSSAIHVNQIGFAPDSPKHAYISLWMGSGGGLDFSTYEGVPFEIRRYNDGKKVFSGIIGKRMAADTVELEGDIGNLTKADIWECNFTALTTPGEYVVSIERLGCSYPFEISHEILKEPFWYAMKGLFFQRAGIVRELEVGRIYPRDHHFEDVVWYYRPDITKPEIPTGKEFDTGQLLKGCYGFYHDAGDWDSYSSHAVVPLALMLLYSLAPDRFADGDVGNRYKLRESDREWINEGCNGLPDVLDEAGWLPNSYRRLRHALLDTGYSDGGVPGYVGRDAIAWSGKYGEGMLPSWEDRRPWIVTRVCGDATMRYAAMAAWYAKSLDIWWQQTHPGSAYPESQEWIEEARSAYYWAKKNRPEKQDLYPGYAALAAVCLYWATRDPVFQDEFKSFRAADKTRGYAQIDIWPWFFYEPVYAMLPPDLPQLDVKAQQESRQYVIQAGESDAAHTERIGFRVFQMTTMYGQLANPRFLAMASAHALSHDESLLRAMQNNAAYFLGGNQRNTVYVTCLGENPDNIIFHPDAWMLNDFKHKVYRWEPLPGYGTYFGQLFDYVSGPGGDLHVQTNAYPDYRQWPRTEMRSGNRESISGNEFTIHQNNIHLAFAFGYLRAMCAGPGGFLLSPRPTVRLVMPENQPIRHAETIMLRAVTSANTRVVKYYQDWHLIGESYDKENGFPILWTAPSQPGATVQITAVAYNDRGRISLPSAEGERTLVITPGPKLP